MSKRDILDYFKTWNVPAKLPRVEEPLEVQTLQTSEIHSGLDTSNVHSIFDIKILVGKKFTNGWTNFTSRKSMDNRRLV